MGDRDRSLLDQIFLKHGPRDLLKSYFIQVDQLLRELGLRVSICTDFDRLAALNRRNRDSWPPLIPFKDPTFNRLVAGQAFWLDVQDVRDDTVVAHSARIFDWSDTTLEQEIKTLRLLYSNPAPHVAAGETIDMVDAASAERISGRVALLGSKWVRPDLRRRGLAKIVAGITRVCSYASWRPHYIIGFVEPRLHSIGVTRAYGEYHVEDGVVFPLGGRGKVPYMLVWMTAETLLRETEKIVGLGNERPIAQQRDAQSESVACFVTPR